jgi:hypothetical protein
VRGDDDDEGGCLVTAEDTEEETRRGMSDTEIACTLLRGSYITAPMFDVWQRIQQGETIMGMRYDYFNPATGRNYNVDTLYEWLNKVVEAIKKARIVEEPVVQEPNPFGIHIASGSDVRLAADNTPQPHRKPRSHFPDPERLKASGKRPR